MIDNQAVSEKKRVALVSVFAAVLLTASKFLVGSLTGSLGILSEALHSGLDLIAAIITYFSVRISDKPADSDHHYGHGKIENLSALVETVLLLITCVWIIYEAVHRLVTGKLHIEVIYWSYIIVIASIVIDFFRSRELMKAAKKYNSQALEADALHFATDIWSSTVVFIGLICANIGWYFADAVAALMVSGIVIYISFRLGKRSINVLLDTAPVNHVKTVEDILKATPEVISFHDVRVRNSGADVFVDLCIHVGPSLNVEECHKIAHGVENKIHHAIDRCVIYIHQEPEGKETAD